eukprot:4817221-Heterocapsa_arctica.AAC.1
MCERNSNTYRGTIFGRFQRQDGEHKCKPKGKRNLTLNRNCRTESYVEHYMVRYIRGSSDNSEGHWNDRIKRNNGGGYFRQRRY